MFGAVASNLKPMFKVFANCADTLLPFPFPPMRLLSFLSDIERAIRMEANADETAIWDATRIVNFKSGLARLTLKLKETDSGMPAGTVLVQHFALANGSFCLKANLAWEGSDASSAVAVYDTPVLNWKLEASRIAAAWIGGPPAQAVAASDIERISAIG